MRCSRRFHLSATTSVLLLAACAPQASAPDLTADRSAIRANVERYVASIEAADPALAREVWLVSEEVSFIHPGGYEVGWDAIQANIYEGAMGGLFSARDLTLGEISVHVFGDTAIAEFEWAFDAIWRKDGAGFQSEGRESQVYRRGEGGWALVHVHYSGAAVEDPEDAF